MQGRAGREVLFEIQRVGTYLKVTAVDPVSLVEVSVHGPAASGEYALRQLAVRKLETTLKRRAEAQR